MTFSDLWAKYSRMGGVGLVAAVLVAVVVAVAGQELVVALWKATLVTGAGYGGYWLDRIAFYDGRPSQLGADNGDGVWTKDDTLGIVYSASMIRRALVMAGTMIAVALAL